MGRSAEASPQGVHAAALDDYLDQVEGGNGGIGSLSVFRDGCEVYHRSFGQKYLPDVKADEKKKVSGTISNKKGVAEKVSGTIFEVRSSQRKGPITSPSGARRDRLR